MAHRRPNPRSQRPPLNEQNTLLNRSNQNQESSSSLIDDASAPHNLHSNNNFKNRSSTDSDVASADQDRDETNLAAAIRDFPSC